ncbi:MAG: HD domain-containing phosphohydrolase [Planctomycetota bacterium]
MTQGKRIRLKEGEELFNKLAVAFSDFVVFSSKHPRYLQSCQNFLDAVDEFFERHPDQTQVLFVYRRGEILFRKLPLSILTPPAVKLVRLLEATKAEGLRFSAGSTLTSISCTVQGISEFKPDDGGTVNESVNRLLEANGLRNRAGLFSDQELAGLEVSGGLLTSESDATELERGILSLPQLELPLELYRNTLEALHDLMTLLGRGGSPEFDPLLEVATQITDGILDGQESFLSLTTVEYSDHFTFNHSVNVCLLVTAALKPLVSNPDRLTQVAQAALLHDLGKSLVPSEMLYMSRVPEGDEKIELERHSALGAEILRDVQGVDPLSVVVAYDHHRRPDGEGYPRVQRSRPVDVVTSVVAAADIFEALTAERPYKKSLSAAAAFQVFSQLPEAKGLEQGLRLLFDALSPFPPGTFVKLDSGDYAVVTRTRPNTPLAPWVRLVAKNDGGWSISPDEIDLSNEFDPKVPKIIQTAMSPWADEETSPDATDSDLERRVCEGTLLASEG